MKKTWDARRILLTVTAVLLAGLLVTTGVEARATALNRAENARLQANIQTLQRELENEAPQGTIRAATAPDGKLEEATYLDFIRTTARADGVDISKWSTSPRKPGDASTAPKKEDPLLKNVVPVVGSLEVVGSYGNVLAFASQLLHAPRLLNLSEVHWLRDDRLHEIRLSMTVTRYVEPAGVPRT